MSASFRVKELRREKNLTQHELAEKSGVSRATIALIEGSRKCNVTVGTLAKLAHALDATVDEIYYADNA